MSALNLPLFSWPPCCSPALAAPTIPALGGICSPRQERGWDTTTPLGVLHGREGRSCWPTLSPEEARPFEQTCKGPPTSPPFKNKHSLWLTLALTLARRGLSRSLCQSVLCSLREERRWKKGFYLSGCLTSREGILLFLQSDPGAALKNISHLPDCSPASL